MTSTEYPRFKTTVDQDRGAHPSGMRYTQLVDIITDYSDYNHHASWESMSEADREWWNDTLAFIHQARVELAELPSEVRSEVQEMLDDEHCDSLDDYPTVVQRIIREYRERA